MRVGHLMAFSHRLAFEVLMSFHEIGKYWNCTFKIVIRHVEARCSLDKPRIIWIYC